MNLLAFQLREAMFGKSRFACLAVFLILFANAGISYATESTDGTHKVRKILEQVHQIADGIKDGSIKIRLLGRIAVVEAELGDKVASGITIQNALDIANAIEDPNRKVAVLFEIGRTQSAAGDEDAAKMTLEQAFQLGKATSGKGNMTPESIKSMAEGGDIKGALNAAATMKDIDSKAIALHGITVTQATAGDMKGALQTANTITKEYGYQARAMEAVAFSQVQAGDEEGALATVDAIQDADGLSFKASALWKIAAIQAKQGNKAAAVRTMQKAVKASAYRTYLPQLPYAKLRSLLAMVETQAQAGDRHSAASTIKQAIAEADTIKDENGKAWALAEIIIAQAKAGDVEGAVKLREGFKEKDPYTDFFLPFIAKSQLEAGNVEAALQIAKVLGATSAFDIHDPFSARSAILLDVSVAQARAGDVDGALQSLDHVKGGYFSSARDSALSVVMTVQGEESIDKSIKWATNFSSPFEKADALLAVAEGIIKQKSKKELETTTTRP